MNQQNNHEPHKAESLTDLELTTEQSEQTKGGGIVRGGAGDDVVLGGDGRDVLIGGVGLDVLIAEVDER